jgi:hypothetical protein
MEVSMRTAIATWGLAAASLVLCAASPIPKDYSGPVARIFDSFTGQQDGGVAFFYLDKINGLTQTIIANAGRGAEMTPVVWGRRVLAEPATFRIAGRTHYAAPILDLTHKGYLVAGEVTFTPQANHTYSVRGVLAPGGSSVWIEDETGAIMDKKIEKNDAAVGILQR